jgi:ribonuclease HII
METNILEKLKIVRSKILGKFERMSLFVVIKRGDVNLWDFVFAAEKLDNPENLKTIADIVNKELNKNEIINISRLVLLDSTDPFAKIFNSTFSVGDENGYMTITDSQINNIRIKEAYLFFSKSN